MRPHLRLHYRWSPGLSRFVWFADLLLVVEEGLSLVGTSYSNDSVTAMKKASEYWPTQMHPAPLAGRKTFQSSGLLT
jgi:hypothetical protein